VTPAGAVHVWLPAVENVATVWACTPADPNAKTAMARTQVLPKNGNGVARFRNAWILSINGEVGVLGVISEGRWDILEDGLCSAVARLGSGQLKRLRDGSASVRWAQRRERESGTRRQFGRPSFCKPRGITFLLQTRPRQSALDGKLHENRPNLAGIARA
jgi:hypothetical protein